MPDVAVCPCGDERGVFFDFGSDVEVAKFIVFDRVESEATAYKKDEQRKDVWHMYVMVYNEDCDEDEL